MLSQLVFFFFTVYNYGNYSNGLGNRWESNRVHLPQWQYFKEFKSPWLKLAACVFLYKYNKQLQYISFSC